MKPLQFPMRRLLLVAAGCFALAVPLMGNTVNSIHFSNDGSELKFELAHAMTPSVVNLGHKIIIKIKDTNLKDGLSLPTGQGAVTKMRSGLHGQDLWIVAVLSRRVHAKLRVDADGFSVLFGQSKASAAGTAVSPSATAQQNSEPDADSAPLQDLSPESSGQTARIVDISLGEAGGKSQVVVSSDAPANYRSVVSADGKEISLYFRNSSLSWAGKEIGGNDPALTSVRARQISVHGESQVVVDMKLKAEEPYTLHHEQNQVIAAITRPAASDTEQDNTSTQTPDLEKSTTCQFQDADVVGVLTDLAESAGFQLRLGMSIQALAEKDRIVSYDADKRPLREVLYGIMSQVVPTGTNYYIKTQGNLLYIGDDAELTLLKLGTGVTTKFYTPRNQPKATLEELVQNTVPDVGDELVKLQDDPTDPDKIMLSGFESDVNSTLKYLRKWDVPETGAAEGSASDDDDSSGDGGSLKTQVFKVRFLDTPDINGVVTQAINQIIPPSMLTATGNNQKGFTWTWDSARRDIVVTSTLKYLKKFGVLLQHLDFPIPQVHIEGKIVEVDASDSKSLGIDWNATQTNGTQSTTGFTQGNGSIIPSSDLIATYTNSAALSNLTATLNALVAKTRANIISSPSVTTEDNVAASVQEVATNYILNQTVVATSTLPVTTNSFTTQTIPMTLQVLPRISKADGKILMVINFTLDSANGVTIANQPQNTSQQQIQTTLMVGDGDTAVIGGVFIDSYNMTQQGVPVLSDIPLLGLLFQAKATVKTKNDIIIFITPTIVPN